MKDTCKQAIFRKVTKRAKRVRDLWREEIREKESWSFSTARVLATVITTFNEGMECTVEEQGQQYVVTYSFKAGINKFGEQAKASAHKEMK